MSWQQNLPRKRCRDCGSSEVFEEETTLFCGDMTERKTINWCARCGSHQIALRGVACDCCDKIVEADEVVDGTDLCAFCFEEIGQHGETDECSRYTSEKRNLI